MEGERDEWREGWMEGWMKGGMDGGREFIEVEANSTYQAQRVVQTCDIGVTTSASSPLFELYTFCFTKPGSTT